MKVIVASTNLVKLHAVKEILETYYPRNGHLPGFEGVYEFNREKIYPEQSSDPFYTKDSLVSLATKQAIEAFKDHGHFLNKERIEFELSIATKEGLVKRLFGASSNYFLVETAVIYNGWEVVGIGFGLEVEIPSGVISKIYDLKSKIVSGYRYPKANIETIVHEKIKEPDSNQKYGLIGLISKNKMMRKDYIKQAVAAAIWPLKAQKLYKDKEEWMIK